MRCLLKQVYAFFTWCTKRKYLEIIVICIVPNTQARNLVFVEVTLKSAIHVLNKKTMDKLPTYFWLNLFYKMRTFFIIFEPFRAVFIIFE